MWKIYVRQYECGLLFDRARFVRVLGPGKYRIWRPWRTRIERICCLDPQCRHPRLDALLRDEQFRARVRVVHLEAHQRGLVWNGNVLIGVIGPGVHAFWKAPYTVKIELYDARAGRLKHPRLGAVAQFAHATTLFSVVNVASDEQLRVLDGECAEEILGPGTYVFWQGTPGLRWKVERLSGGELARGKAPVEGASPCMGRAPAGVVHRPGDGPARQG